MKLKCRVIVRKGILQSCFTSSYSFDWNFPCHGKTISRQTAKQTLKNFKGNWFPICKMQIHLGEEMKQMVFYIRNVSTPFDWIICSTLQTYIFRYFHYAFIGCRLSFLVMGFRLMIFRCFCWAQIEWQFLLRNFKDGNGWVERLNTLKLRFFLPWKSSWAFHVIDFDLNVFKRILATKAFNFEAKFVVLALRKVLIRLLFLSIFTFFPKSFSGNLSI